MISDKLITLDQTLSQVTASGDNLMLIAKARMLIKDIYDSMKGVETDG